MLFTAESGSTPDGQIGVASKTGLNNFYGGLFEFLRNDIFDARQPINTLNAGEPPFCLNQYRGSIGGPIVRDKTFFYFNYEGLRQTFPRDLRDMEMPRAISAGGPIFGRRIWAWPSVFRWVSGRRCSSAASSSICSTTRSMVCRSRISPRAPSARSSER